MEYNNIDDFKNNFTQIYTEEVLPKLKYFDHERCITKTKSSRIFWILIIAGILLISTIFFMPQKSGGISQILQAIGIFAIIGGFVVKSTMAKDFETKLKTYIMPLLMKAFGNFSWTQESRFTENEIKNADIFSYFENMETDDNFSGIYRDMPVEISETHLTYTTRDSKGRRTTHTRFKGILISIGAAKKFTSHTIVRTRALIGNKKVYEEVKLEDPEFQKKFFVDSNDQIEARFLLTPAFIERFKNISTSFYASESQCSFRDGKVLVALSVSKDLFKLGDLYTPVTDSKAYKIFLNEIISIFEMVDHLKLLEKTGL